MVARLRRQRTGPVRPRKKHRVALDRRLTKRRTSPDKLLIKPDRPLNPWEKLRVRPATEPEVATVSARRSEEHTSELQLRQYLVCRLLLEKKKIRRYTPLFNQPPDSIEILK